jgi:putative transposase
MRKESFVNDQYYHVFNRGVDKREIFSCGDDFARFFQSMEEFNSLTPIGSIYENSFNKIKPHEPQLGDPISKLVEFVCYCLNPNHYHFILRQVSDNGIEKFMQRLGIGYTMFFNNKYKRSGSLFQGRFKAKRVDSNEYLLHLSAYVNLNNKVHGLGDLVSKSSWDEYASGRNGFCGDGKEIILGQFKNIEEYKNFAGSSLEDIKQRREMKEFFLE